MVGAWMNKHNAAMYILTHNLRGSMHRAPTLAKQVTPRVLTTLKSDNYSELEEPFLHWTAQAFSHRQRLSIPCDFELLLLFQRHGSSPSPQTLCEITSFCANSGSLEMGIQIHAYIVKLGFYFNLYISSTLVDMYGKNLMIRDAHKLFEEMLHRNVVTWNSLISAHLRNGSPHKAILLFQDMLKLGIAPTTFSLSSVVMGCSQLEAGELGTQLHGLITKTGFWPNVVLGTELINMYINCRQIQDSRLVFDLMPEKNVITWTSMISCYAQTKQPNEAMILVHDMLHLDLKPNYVTYNCLLSSISSPNHFNQCQHIHCRIIREGFETNSYIVVTLVSVYSECNGSLEDFRKVCLMITRFDQVSWNAVIAGFSNLKVGEEAVECFNKMRQTCISADSFTFTSLFGAVGSMSSLEEGKQLHSLVHKTGYTLNLYVQNGLVSMYANCGAIKESKSVFSQIEKRDLVSWNALLTGCAHHGFGMEAIELFEEMRRTPVKPDNTTFLAVLTACSHVGFLDKGLKYFNMMRECDFLEPPKPEHYAAVVDLFGRSGNLHEAEAFIASMPFEPGPSVYKALLSACQIHGNREIALRTAKQLLELHPNDPASYVLLSNVYASEGYWVDAAGVRELMCDKGIDKIPGCSLI